ncbi:MAG: glutamate-5-semialdehyde dehydrogenase [Bradymonadia bacterium]
MTHTEELSEQIAKLAEAAKAAAPALAQSSESLRNAALDAMAQNIERDSGDILQANDKDLRLAAENGLSEAMIDRLRLSPERLKQIAQSIQHIRMLPDPIGKIEGMQTRPNALRVGRMRIPLGVIAMIYEARPNVTSDASALCIKSGNAIVLKGGKEAFNTNAAIVKSLKFALTSVGLPSSCISFVETLDRKAVSYLIKQKDCIDLLIPRGGESLIHYVTDNSSIPVIQHYKGVCHIFVEKTVQAQMLSPILLNAKCQRPGVCNAMECLLLDAELDAVLAEQCLRDLAQNGVTLHVDERILQKFPQLQNIVPATDEDWGKEYLSLDLAVKEVDGIKEAIAHIQQYGSLHTEAILSSDYFKIQTFCNSVNSSTVLVNASTRFADGGELGLGAEIGISTSKLHAFGPMGINELTTTKFVVQGNGQVRN